MAELRALARGQEARAQAAEVSLHSLRKEVRCPLSFLLSGSPTEPEVVDCIIVSTQRLAPSDIPCQNEVLCRELQSAAGDAAGRQRPQHHQVGAVGGAKQAGAGADAGGAVRGDGLDEGQRHAARWRHQEAAEVVLMMVAAREFYC